MIKCSAQSRKSKPKGSYKFDQNLSIPDLIILSLIILTPVILGAKTDQVHLPPAIPTPDLTLFPHSSVSGHREKGVFHFCLCMAVTQSREVTAISRIEVPYFISLSLSLSLSLDTMTQHSVSARWLHLINPCLPLHLFFSLEVILPFVQYFQRRHFLIRLSESENSVSKLENYSPRLQ